MDAVLWYRADADELVGSLREEERGQLLLRALLFRLMSSELLSRQAVGLPGPRPTDDDLRWEAQHAAPLVAAVERRLT